MPVLGRLQLIAHFCSGGPWRAVHPIRVTLSVPSAAILAFTRFGPERENLGDDAMSATADMPTSIPTHQR